MEDDSSKVLAFGGGEKESDVNASRSRGPFARRDSELTDLPVEDDSLSSEDPSFASSRAEQALHSDEGNTFDEDEMNAHLADVESSFLPEGNANGEQSERAGIDDTYLELGRKKTQGPLLRLAADAQHATETTQSDLHDSENDIHVSSPTIAAATRAHSRTFSADSAKPRSMRIIPSPFSTSTADSSTGTPSTQRPLSQGSTVRQDNDSSHSSSLRSALTGINGVHPSSRLRPSTSRQISRSSISDISGSEGGLDIDYALHTGGSLSTLGSSRSALLSRLPSLGSVASSIMAEGQREPARDISGSSLLASASSNRPSTRDDGERPETPRANPSRFTAPTDTVIAQHVQSIQVPETVARDFRARNRTASPNKRVTVSELTQDRARRTLTLKEQNNKVDKLTKENFDLKLKIHFLDQALQNRSDDGVKELIDQSVQFQTDLANERKEAQTLRRRMREMERRIKEQGEALTQALQQQKWSRMDDEDDPSLQAEMHEEILILRQKLDHSENTISTLREDLFTSNTERRKMSETIKSMASKRGEDNAGMKETISTWEDLLNAAEGQREQAEEDAQRLREELNALRLEHASPVGARNGRTEKRRSRLGSAPTMGASEDSDAINDLRQLESHNAQVEQLRHEISELRKQLGAQTNMLSSRNREKEIMSQEISDLKLIIDGRDGGRSMAGESIFDRSISRTHNRAASRASDHTGVTQVTEAERDMWDKREGQLRDENADLKLKLQELERTHATHLKYIGVLESDYEEMEKELVALSDDLRQIQVERDEALQAYDEREAEYNQLKEEALVEIERLDEDKRILQAQLEEALTSYGKINTKLQNTTDGYKGLQGELREITQSVMNLEDEKQANVRTIQTLEQQMAEAEDELQKLEQKCSDLDNKRLKLEVDQEGLQNEIKFLRTEQEGHIIQIGDLEHSLHNAQQTISDEQEKLREMEEAMVEERQQRDVLENRSKEEVQKVLDDLNSDNAKSKDQIRTLRRSLSAREVEANSWRQRLEEYEQSLCDLLGDRSSSKQSILGDIERLQRDLETTMNELDRAKMDIADKDRLLRHRDGLLESTSLESRRLSDLLDKERASRKHDLDSFDKASRGQASHMRTIAQQESRLLELETTYTQQQRKMASLEEQYHEQMLERNSLLLALWNRLSTLCGAEWAQNHSLVNGEVPSTETIHKHLPSFHRNVISAVKQTEKIIGDFKLRIRRFEKEVLNDYQTLNNNLDIRLRRMDAVERAFEEHKRALAVEAARAPPNLASNRPSTSNKLIKGSGNGEEATKLKNEIKLLKSELRFHRQHPSPMAQQMLNQQMQLHHPEHLRRASSSAGSATAGAGSKKDSSVSPARQIVAQLLRHHSTHAIEQLSGSAEEETPPSSRPQKPIPLAPPPMHPSDQRWQARLIELERRLKAEREARLLDRQGARQRLEEGRAENEELRMRLEREMERRGSESLDLGTANGRNDARVSGADRGFEAAAPEELAVMKGKASEGSLD